MSAKSKCEKVYGLLGLAAKKGAIVSGGSACERALKNDARYLMILAADASTNTRDKFLRYAWGKTAGHIIFGTRYELGRRVGMGVRSVVLVTDEGLARGICDLLGFSDDENGGVKFG